MIYDLSKPEEWDQLYGRLEKYLTGGKRIEVKLVREKRSITQNRYLHVVITLFGMHFGYTLEESKALLKRKCHFVTYEKNGNYFVRSTADMDSKELTEFIEWIRNYSSKNGCYIPTSEEYLLDQYRIDKEISAHKEYM